MLGRSRDKPSSSYPDEVDASQPPGSIFPWERGMMLTAVDEVTIALSKGVIAANETVGDVIQGGEGIEIGFASTGDTLFIKLRPGVSATLTKSSQAYIVSDDPDDPAPKRLRVRPSSGSGLGHDPIPAGP